MQMPRPQTNQTGLTQAGWDGPLKHSIFSKAVQVVKRYSQDGTTENTDRRLTVADAQSMSAVPPASTRLV